MYGFLRVEKKGDMDRGFNKDPQNPKPLHNSLTSPFIKTI
jgi:hypothetical protein